MVCNTSPAGGGFCYKYPHPAVTTDCVVFGFDGRALRVLLIRRGHAPFRDRWATPGGFLDPDEEATRGALRELREETGMEGLAEVWELFSLSQPDRDPRERVISLVFMALTGLSAVRGGDDAAEARWFEADALPPLAFDHADAVRRARVALRRRSFLAPLGRGVLPAAFPPAEFAAFYAAVRGEAAVDAAELTHWALAAGFVRRAAGEYGLLCFDDARYDALCAAADSMDCRPL